MYAAGCVGEKIGQQTLPAAQPASSLAPPAAAPQQADPPKKARAVASASSKSAGRAERMFRLNMRSAEQGDPVAQLEVGKAFLDGVGAEQNTELARHWLEQAEQQGVKAATAHLALAK